MNEGTRSGKSTIRLLGISAERPTNGLYLYLIHKIAEPEEKQPNSYTRNITARVTLCSVQCFMIGRKWILKYCSGELQIQNI
jgi:hypothetical protein